MRSDYDLEKEIRFVLRESQLQKPPQELLNRFEDQVWSRITNPRAPLPWVFLAAPALLLLILLTSYAFWLLKPAPMPLPEMSQILSSASATSPAKNLAPAKISMDSAPQETLSMPENKASISDEELDSRIRDLLVLEWLGEADGLLEGLNQMPGMAETALPKTI